MLTRGEEALQWLTSKIEKCEKDNDNRLRRQSIGEKHRHVKAVFLLNDVRNFMLTHRHFMAQYVENYTE